MKFKFPFSRSKNDQYFLTLDIGTEAVKALIFQKSGEKIMVLGSSLQYFDRWRIFDTSASSVSTLSGTEWVDSKSFEADVIKKTISETLQNLGRQAREIKKLPENVLFGLPANLLKGRVLSQSFKRKNFRMLIDKKEEIAIYQKIFSKTKERISQSLTAESGILPRDIHWVSLKVLEIEIDGYQIPMLRGYNGKNLDFRIFATFLLKYHLKSIEDIARDFNLKISKIVHPAPNLPDFLSIESKNAIFLDVGGQVTGIFLVKDGKLEGIEEFEIGASKVTQSLSYVLGMTEREGRELKERYSKGLLSIEVQKRIREIFSESKRDWYENLKLKIKKINPKGLLPSTIFLFGGGSLLPEIQEVLEKGDWGELSFSQPPRVKFLYSKDLRNILEPHPKNEAIIQVLNNPQYTPSLLICYTGLQNRSAVLE